MKSSLATPHRSTHTSGYGSRSHTCASVHTSLLNFIGPSPRYISRMDLGGNDISVRQFTIMLTSSLTKRRMQFHDHVTYSWSACCGSILKIAIFCGIVDVPSFYLQSLRCQFFTSFIIPPQSGKKWFHGVYSATNNKVQSQTNNWSMNIVSNVKLSINNVDTYMTVQDMITITIQQYHVPIQPIEYFSTIYSYAVQVTVNGMYMLKICPVQ
jgi:hypothetical protein